MPFEFFSFSTPSKDYRGRSRDGPPFGHPDDCPEEYGVPEKATSWWGRFRGHPFGPPFTGERPDGWHGPWMNGAGNSEIGERGEWRGPPWMKDGFVGNEHSRHEGWNNRGGHHNSEIGERGGWRGPPWMKNGFGENEEHSRGWRGPWMQRDGPFEHGDHSRPGWRGPPWMNRDGPENFSAERSRPEGWRGPPWWFARGGFPGNEGSRLN